MADEQWYFCLVHNTVEPYEGCRSENRLGPYASRDDAAAALQHAQQRNEEWENDPRFNDEEEDEDDGPSAFDALRP